MAHCHGRRWDLLGLCIGLMAGSLTLGVTPPQTRPAGRQAASGRTPQTRPAESRTAQTRPAEARGVQTQPAQTHAARPGLPTPETQIVHFPTEDNLLIAGAYTPPAVKKGERAPMIILLHMYASDHSAFDPLVPHLHAAGFAVLAIDLRGHGQSVGAPEMGLAQRVAERDKKLFAAMDRDVDGAYRWLVKQPAVDPARFVLVGASVGCSVALKYAGRDRSVDGVVCLTPGTGYLGIDSLSDAHKYGRRPLLLVASEDERTACDELARLVPGALVQIEPGAGEKDKMAYHGTRMLGQVVHIEQSITGFLLKAAGPASENMVMASVQGDVYHPSGGTGAGQINPENVRWFSSPEEAEARGLRPPKTKARSSGTKGRSSAAGEEQFPGSESRPPKRK